MKKILSTIIAAIMLLCSISAITGCKNNDNSNNNNSKAEVVLDKVSAAAYNEPSIKPQKMAAFNLSEKSTDNSENESADNSESESESPDVSADIPDYTFIFKSQTTINFDIKLNNPKNYYIMDFKLTCDEEQIEYYDKEMEKWTPINDIWIRWSGSNNQESRYRLRLPNPEISPDKIKISEMYYSDRTDGTNKTAVNMNNKETYTVYKVEDDLVVTETISNSREKYVFRMNQKEGVEIKSFTVAGVDYMDRINDEGLYEMTNNGKIVVEYERKNGNVVYKGKYEKDIELLEYEFMIYMEKIRLYSIIPNDPEKYYDYAGTFEYLITFKLSKELKKGTDTDKTIWVIYKPGDRDIMISSMPFLLDDYSLIINIKHPLYIIASDKQPKESDLDENMHYIGSGRIIEVIDVSKLKVDEDGKYYFEN